MLIQNLFSIICLFTVSKMKNTFSLLFLLIYLVANTELHQFLRLPIFFEHYQEHRLDNREISLIDFIVLHYFSGDIKDGDDIRDEQLPFKNANCPEVSISIAIAMPPEDLPETEVQAFTLARNVVVFKSLFNASSFHFSIWQPPRP